MGDAYGGAEEDDVTSPVTVKVTVEDPETGETISRTITDDYVVITAGSCYLDGTAWYANGTRVLTVKGAKGGAR